MILTYASHVPEEALWSKAGCNKFKQTAFFSYKICQTFNIFTYTLKISKRKIGHLKMLENFMILYICSLSVPSEILWKCWQEIVCSVKHDLLYKRRSPFYQFQRYDFSCRQLGSMGSWEKGGLVSSFKWSSPSTSLSACCLLFSVNPTWNLGAGRAGLWISLGSRKQGRHWGTQFKEALPFGVVKCRPRTYLNPRVSASLSHAPQAPSPILGKSGMDSGV